MNNKGFTLVELLIVISILGILVAAIAPRYVSFTQDAKNAATQANLSALRGALTLYAGNSDGGYPSTAATLPGNIKPNYIMDIPLNKQTSCNTVVNGNAGACNVTVGWVYCGTNGFIWAAGQSW